MRFHSVESHEVLDCEVGHYSLGIFASGFENRSMYVASKLGATPFQRLVVFSRMSEAGGLTTLAHDSYFRGIGAHDFYVMDGEQDDKQVFALLDSVAAQSNGHLRILVDYSAMTRAWYGAILTWARLTQLRYSVEIDFVYAGGKYLDEFDPLLISELVCLPNFEGLSGGFRRTTALFGLGYDRYATLAVHDRIEPDVMYCCVAGSLMHDASAQKAAAENRAMVEASERVIELPLLDVASAFRLLCNVVVSIGRDSHVVVVPMGPKTHVLVTLLVALRLPWLTCLHPKGIRQKPVRVEADGSLSVARVFFQPLSGFPSNQTMAMADPA